MLLAFGGTEARIGKVRFTPNEPAEVLNEEPALPNYELDAQQPGPGVFCQDGTPVAGHQFENTLDDTGNRKTAGRGEDYECIRNSR